MNTPNIPDDELDDFFRKSLEKPEIDFREEDWLRLEKKLNTAAQQKSVNRRFLYSLTALLLLSAALVTWFMVGGASDNASGASTQITTSKEIPSQASTPDQTFVQPPDKITTPATAQRNNLSGKSKTPASTFTENAEKNTVNNSNKEKSIENTGIATSTEKKLTTSIKSDVKSDEDKSTNESNVTPVLPDSSSKERNRIVSKQPNNKTVPVNEKVISGKALQNTSKEKESPDLIERPATEITETTRIAKQPGKINKPGKEGISPANETNLPLTSDERQTTADTDVDITGKEKKTPESKSRNTFTTEEKSDIESNDAALPETIMEGEESIQNFMSLSPLSSLTIKTSGVESILQDKYADSLEKKIEENALAVYAFQKDSAQRKPARERLTSRFSLNLLLSPDLSSVGFSHRAAPGTNTGISLEYHLSNAWSISVGAIYSTKIYGADAKDYTPKPGFWTYYVWPVEVKGNCKVIDIPINIRYNFLRRERSNVYATTGLSSYLMLKEDYKYIYDVDDTYLRKYWHTSNENKHFFKVYNFSLGYERRLSQRFSLQAEPFIKLPLAGVGFGQIKLLTTGAFVSVKYRL